MIDDTKAANSGAAQPSSLDNSRMHEIEPVEGVVLVLDAAEHMDAAGLAGVALDGGVGIDHPEFFSLATTRHFRAA